MTDSQEINELAPVPEFTILRLAHHNLRGTLSLFAEEGWSIAEEPKEVYRQFQYATFEAVLKHEASGRYFRTYWKHTFFRDEMTADPSNFTKEVFPREIKVTIFETPGEKAEATND